MNKWHNMLLCKKNLLDHAGFHEECKRATSWKLCFLLAPHYRQFKLCITRNQEFIVRRLLHPDMLHAVLGLLQNCNTVLNLQHGYKDENILVNSGCRNIYHIIPLCLLIHRVRSKSNHYMTTPLYVPTFREWHG
jgi:hypothetical protein